MAGHQLNQLPKKGAVDTFELNNDQFDAFKTFIDAVFSPKVLALRKPDLSCSVVIDASKHGLRGTRFQTHEDGGRKFI